MTRFFIVLTVVAVVITVLTLEGAGRACFTLPSFLYGTIGLLYVVTAAIYAYLVRINKPGDFLQLYLLTMVAKLVVFFLYNLVMVFSDPTLALENVVLFLVTYFLFTALEVAFLYRKIGRPGAPS